MKKLLKCLSIALLCCVQHAYAQDAKPARKTASKPAAQKQFVPPVQLSAEELSVMDAYSQKTLDIDAKFWAKRISEGRPAMSVFKKYAPNWAMKEETKQQLVKKIEALIAGKQLSELTPEEYEKISSWQFAPPPYLAGPSRLDEDAIAAVTKEQFIYALARTVANSTAVRQLAPPTAAGIKQFISNYPVSDALKDAAREKALSFIAQESFVGPLETKEASDLQAGMVKAKRLGW